MITLHDEDLYLEDFSDVWFTNCDARYRVLKGGRSTGKTYNFCGLESVFKILSDKRRNIMMVRQNEKDNAQSNFTIIKAICNRLGISHLFKFTTSPHKIVRKDTGQVILFGGMNDVENLTGTSVECGYLTDIYFEEAFQLRSYEDFRIVDGSFRIPNYESNLKIQITFCMNAWDTGHWINDVFFKNNLDDDPFILESERFQFKHLPEFTLGADGKGLALHISSSYCNPYNSEARIEGAKMLKEKAYDIYLTEVLGCWGNTADRTYNHFSESLIHNEQEINNLNYDVICVGIDTGLSNGEGKIKYSETNAPRIGSAMTMQLCGVCDNWDKLVAIDEYYDTNIGRSIVDKKKEYTYVEELCEKLVEWCNTYNLWDDNLMCYVDSADVGFRDNMEDIAHSDKYRLYNCTFVGSTKIKILDRVRFTNMMMARDEIWISSRCSNLAREIRNARKAKDGKCREDYDDHAINAWEYSWSPLRVRLNMWHDFKPLE